MAVSPMPVKYPVTDQGGRMTRIWVMFLTELANFIGTGESGGESSSILATLQNLQTSVTALERETDALNQGRTL